VNWQLDGRPLRRILVTRLRYLGDVAMTTVVLAVLRRGDPEVHLGFLGEADHVPLLLGQPDLDRLHALAIRRRGADAAARGRQIAGDGGLVTGGTWATLADLRRARYDLAVDLLFNPRSAWLLRLAGIPARIGGAPRGYRRRLYTHLAEPPHQQDRPDLYQRAGGGLGEHLSRLAPLARADGTPFLDWFASTYRPGELAPAIARPALESTLCSDLTRLGAVPDSYVLLAPGATWPTKRWPQERWRELAAALQAIGWQVVVLSPPHGDAAAADLATVIARGRGGVLPPLPLRAALAVAASAAVVITVDGGLMHAAVAMQVPTVALFGPTDPQLWFPYEALGPYRVLATRPVCHPCHLQVCPEFVCLPELGVKSVLAAVAQLGSKPAG
jgi:ADP-heptose:LPS heptosyltransferase